MFTTHISFSEYRLFRQCAFKHFLTKTLKMDEGTSEALIFGSALHAAIEEIVKKNKNKITWGKVFEQKLKKETNDVVINSYFGKNFKYQGAEILKELNIFERFKEYEIVGCEYELYEPLYTSEEFAINFKGIIDLVLKKDGRYLILDWKSANSTWDLQMKFNLKETSPNVYEYQEDPKDKSFFGQLALYKHFYSQKFNIPLELIDTCFVALPRMPVKAQRYDIDISESFLNYILADIQSAAKEILNINPMDIPKAKFEDKNRCNYCAFKKDKAICSDDKTNNILENEEKK